MQHTTSFGAFLVAALATSDFAAAVPTGPRQHAPIAGHPVINTRGTVHQVPRSTVKTHAKMGALALEKAYLKYNTAMPTDLNGAVSRIRANLAAGLKPWGIDIDKDGDIDLKRATGSAVTTPEEYDVEYLTPVQIGNPPQTLNLNFDTGSSDLWVYSSATPASEVNGQAVYDLGASNTSVKATGQSWSISYGDGSNSKGDVYYDTVAVGGLSVNHMAVEVAVEVSTEFTADTNMDGLLGLGFSSLNTVSPTQQATFFDSAKSQLDSFLFTADLKAGQPGSYNFGYIDAAAYTGDLYYTPVDTQLGYWMFAASGFSIGDAAFNASQIAGIADTGTTLLMLPVDVVTAYYAQVSGASYDASQGGYTFPCASTTPDFTIGIGDEGRIVIPGEYINYAPVDATNTTCFGGIQDDSDIGFAIFGDIALKAAFVVFDGGAQPRLGWANKDLGLAAEDAAAQQVVVVTTVTTIVS